MHDHKPGSPLPLDSVSPSDDNRHLIAFSYQKYFRWMWLSWSTDIIRGILHY